MGEDVTPTLISRYETQVGNTQDKLNVIVKKVYDWHRQDTRMKELGDVCVTAAAGWGQVETICRTFWKEKKWRQ